MIQTTTVISVLLFLVSVIQCTLGGKIVSGRDAKEGEFPYQVSLQYRYFYGEGAQRLCGGAIIDEHHVITAAHCTYGRFVSHLFVIAGTLDLANEDDSKSVTLNISEVYEHENYDNEWFLNDIAILRVDGRFPLSNPSIGAIPMQPEHLVPPVTCVVTGWGNTFEEPEPYPDVLQALEVPLLDSEVCTDLYAAYGGLDYGMMCAGYTEGGKDACDGDSGGPLACKGLLTGVVSWGNSCALPKYPGVYTEVALYRGWIESTLARSAVEGGLLTLKNAKRRTPMMPRA